MNTGVRSFTRRDTWFCRDVLILDVRKYIVGNDLAMDIFLRYQSVFNIVPILISFSKLPIFTGANAYAVQGSSCSSSILELCV